ncbi:MAG: EAL domain-containing protein [Methylococcaceae bacterium]|nr:EAL domain-containing protein [Methylococcaceae bacterium]
MLNMLRFLSAPPDVNLIYVDSYNPTWVTVSVLLAIISSYAALKASSRIEHQSDTASKLTWTLISTFILGVGIWSMHFIGMLALSLPCNIHYDPFITLMSMLPSLLASGVSLGVVWHHGTRSLPPWGASLLLGTGIGIMHYTGMAAMRLDGFVGYNPYLFTLSIIVAIALSYFALRVKVQEVNPNTRHHLLIAVILGSAVSGMHYTAMSAAYFVRGPISIEIPPTDLTSNTLAILIALTTIFLALTGLVLVAVSSNREVTKQLRDNEQRLKIATDSGQVGIWDFDLQSNALIWDETMFNLYRARKEDFSGAYDAWLTRLHPEDMAAAEAALQDAIAGRREFATEFRIIGPDGEVHYIKGHAHVIRDKTGKPLRLIGTNWDNSAHAMIQQQLKFAHAAINKSRSSFFWINSKGKVIDINDCTCQNLGYNREELIGQYIWCFDQNFPAESWPKQWAEQKQAVTRTFDSLHRHKDGNVFPVEITANCIDVDGVEYCFFFTHDITDRKAADAQIKQLAFHDPLTQLPNRRLLEERLKHSINVERREGKQLALLMLDLDHFKAVNDSLGHQAGDELLQQVAVRITERLREVDIVARLGGDEFTILLEDISQPEDAARVADEIITCLTKPFNLSQCDHIQIGASIGISLYPLHGSNPDILMDHADAALYQAKDAGRGCFAYFSEELTLAAQERIALEIRLRRAIEQNELRVFYQPQMDILSGRIVGAEALVRWQDPINGLLSPIHFIPVAEESGLIMGIGEWVLRETCRQGRQWMDAGLPPITLAVNVSPHQFRRSNLSQLVATVLAETNFPVHLLELEITETGLMENQGHASAILNSLRTQGLRLAIDDFGTGYSSLAALKHFPLDVLKIDKSFIDEIPFNKDDMEIAATIISMGHTLGFKVLAEGVETAEQLAFLREHGCDTYQGFIKSCPIPAEEFVELVQYQ